ncbi:MAG: hypothetical protein PVI57_13195 [Gemmatimonadota bacterium]|jgi:hypothetical protein
MSGGGEDGRSPGGRETAEARAAYEGFALAVRIMYMLYAPEAPASEVERPWEVVKEIAEGRLSLANPAELAARFPDMKDLLFDTANQVVARERETATAVLEGLQEAL